MPNRNTFKSKEKYNAYFRDYRKKNLEKMREYNRLYNRKWRNGNGYESEMNYKERNPEKYKAHQLLNYAIRMGMIKRGKCEVCGKSNAQGHHEDYSKPLEVVWLCPIHHTEHHRNLTK
jgi:hypothetical protein